MWLVGYILVAVFCMLVLPGVEAALSDVPFATWMQSALGGNEYLPVAAIIAALSAWSI